VLVTQKPAPSRCAQNGPAPFGSAVTHDFTSLIALVKEFPSSQTTSSEEVDVIPVSPTLTGGSLPGPRLESPLIETPQWSLLHNSVGLDAADYPEAEPSSILLEPDPIRLNHHPCRGIFGMSSSGVASTKSTRGDLEEHGNPIDRVFESATDNAPEGPED
jgi:hypothetical protein